MPWLQISISVDQSSTKKVEAILLDQGACSVTLKDAADEPILEPAPNEIRLWQKTIVTGLFENTSKKNEILANIRSSLQPHDYEIPTEIETEILEDQDWSRNWMEHYHPMKFGERLWICPHHIEPPNPKAVNLRLDPGLAFGTGTHPTTSLCLSWLDQHCKHQGKILDYGCGSGVLAIAALLLDVQFADGIDIDTQAIEASITNARTNHVADRLQLYTPDQFETHLSKQQKVSEYEIVVANILSKPLIELAPVLASHTQKNGDIVLSGILKEQTNEVLNAYAEYFTMTPPVEMEDWVLLHGHKL
jgi:ribosomal protein L11 methyltransferase